MNRIFTAKPCLVEWLGVDLPWNGNGEFKAEIPRVDRVQIQRFLIRIGAVTVLVVAVREDIRGR